MALSSDEKDFLSFQKNATKSTDKLLAYYRKQKELGVPHVYICGKMLFFDLEIYVTPDCLIPRLETELLVERALQRLPDKGCVLDLCTGSGAIGLAIKSKKPLLDVFLSDISAKALEVAKKNAEENHLDVNFRCGDFLDSFSRGEFDAIICNPPYITDDEFEGLDSLVKDHEPKIALTDGRDGLTFYRKLAQEAFFYLKPSGILCLEIGKDQGKGVVALFSDKLWKDVVVEKDYSGHDRFVFLTKKELE
ncbi:MAG: Release factor glutamine methyltransferase [Chlamydiia bacterium]|nr:Release factor glutamine methyltransferase [Chlamydiia bacterium]MCH9623718.1 Release factor glutamine methyltransferase [Chlamydiia bacterium]